MFMRLREFTKVRGECDMKIRSDSRAEQGLTLRMCVTLEDCGAGDLRGWGGAASFYPIPDRLKYSRRASPRGVSR